MSDARLDPFTTIGRKNRSNLSTFIKPSQQFRSRVFPTHHLSKQTLEQYNEIVKGKAKLDGALADEFALSMKEWALAAGATHYTHWFQPLTGAAAEKHDAFLSWTRDGFAVEKFSGKDLMRGEPDASSFPSGGLRATHQARGYTVWDVTSLPFLWEGGDGLTLCIPSLFFSWNGEALDHKIPLFRSEEKINREVLRLLKICGVQAEKVSSTLGIEQEYFVVDRKWFEKRADLKLAGRTVYGARPPKGQELEDHYFGVLKERVLSYMRDFEDAALELGIPVKTRHSEVAPSQYEIAPLFEKCSSAIDHNVLLMELMRQKASKHGLACLFHEKPFQEINGSGKHNNWSLATDTGLNLFDPKQDSFVFLILLTAVLRAVHEHAGLLRASIGSAGNDYRLGGSEAPPTILSVYLGDYLEQIIHHLIEDKTPAPETFRNIDLGLHHIPLYQADSSDRNRTSFFAFTGNKFEFRAVGASAHCGLPITVINAIVADSLQLILDEISDCLGDSKDLSLSLPVLKKHLKAASPVIFSGNGYSAEWEEEASHRALPNIRKSFSSFSQILEKKSQRAFSSILNEKELHSRYEILVEQYAKTMNIELNLMVELFRTQILPAALEDQKNRAKSLSLLEEENEPQETSLKALSTCIGEAITAVNALEHAQKQTLDLGWEAKGKVFCELIFPKMQQARFIVDRLETMVDYRLWPLPKYKEILFN